MEEPGRLQSMGSRSEFHFSLSCIGDGNGNPPQCSCLENPRDGGVWWAAFSGVAQGGTRLKQLSSSSSNASKLTLCHNKHLRPEYSYLCGHIIDSLNKDSFESERGLSLIIMSVQRIGLLKQTKTST